jgi:hypothetical protein
VLALDIAARAHPLQERLYIIGVSFSAREPTDAMHVRWRLRRGDDRRREDTKGESDDNPDGTAPHDGLLTSFLCIPCTQSAR